MRLDEVAAELRLRQGVESIDLGILLGRRFWLNFIGPWLVMVVPLLVVVQVAVGVALNLVVAILLGWWLKPLFDRVVLHVISRGFFGAPPSTAETVRAVWKQWWSWQAFADLTWRRLSPVRVLSMPVRVLEQGGDGQATRRRMSSLYGSVMPGLGWVLLAGIVGFKWLLYLAMLALVGMFGLSGLEGIMFDFWGTLFGELSSPVAVITVVILATTATTLVEPFYVAGGFGIYIQRRIEREGWDLELKFRKLVRRVEGVLERSAAVLLVAALTACMTVLAPGAQAAAEEFDESWDDGRGQITLEETWEEPPGLLDIIDRGLIPVDDPEGVRSAIMEDDPFVEQWETVTRWVPKNPIDEPQDPPFEIDPKWIGAFAELGRIVIWVFGAGLLLFLIWKLVKFWQRYGGVGRSEESLQAKWAAELIDDEEEALELPGENIGGTARALWQEGRHRRALAMLLLASLVAVEERYPTRFKRGWTTTRCAREAEPHRPEGPVLAAVARAFNALAWAGIHPSDAEFDGLVGRWQAVFEADARRPS